jgi:predicted nucleotidyltransferase component of viral defense system
MQIDARAARERVHFVFLERLLKTSDPRLYALKGGVNLRFFFGSPRYSEDMDLDVDPKVAVGTLRKNGYKVLGDPAVRRVLRTGGIADLVVNDPARAKHTDTTQRFRFSIVLASGESLPTKVEFSRRGIVPDDVRVERIDPEIARAHARIAYSCPHYVAAEAIRQKIRALAGRAVTQARDAFDLYLLDARGAFVPEVVEPLDATLLEAAAEKLATLTFDDYRGHVIEYLDEDGVLEYGSMERFRAIVDRLFELLAIGGGSGR